MQVVCEATQSLDTQVRVAALQCLVKIMSLYYQYMEQYMGPALFAVCLVVCFFSALCLKKFPNNVLVVLQNSQLSYVLTEYAC